MYDILDYSGNFQLSYQMAPIIQDLEQIMRYLGGVSWSNTRNAIELAFANGQSKKIDTDFFIFTAYKKGTLHITFKDETLLRRFNIEACKGKNWLPQDYGQKAKDNLSPDENEVAKEFEEGKYTQDTFTLAVENSIKLLE